MAANLIFTDDVGVEETSIELTTDPGVASTAVALRAFNDDGGGPVDEAPSPTMIFRQLNATNEAVLRGLRAIDERWLEVRALGTGSSGSTQPATGWERVGRGLWFEFDSLPSGEYHDLEIRYFPPATAQGGKIQFLVDLEPGPLTIAHDAGTSETVRDGVMSGAGQTRFDELFVGGDVVENPAGADDDVQVPDLYFLHDAIFRAILEHLITLNNLDGSAVALAAGEAYQAVLSVGASSTVTVTKGDKDTIGAPPLIPATPAGEIPLCVVLRDDTGIINDSDITQRSDVGGFALGSTGLNLEIGPGRLHLDNGIMRRTIVDSVTLPSSSTSFVFALPGGGFTSNTTGLKPESRAYLLCEADTDGSNVTAIRDRRDRVGGEVLIYSLERDGTVAAGSFYLQHGRERTAYIRMPRGISFGVGDLEGGGGAHTQGQYKLEVFKSNGSGTFVTIFTSSGTDDRRPVVNWNDTGELVSYDGPDGPALPDVVAVEPGRILRFDVTEPTAFDGTPDPTGWFCRVVLEMD